MGTERTADVPGVGVSRGLSRGKQQRRSSQFPCTHPGFSPLGRRRGRGAFGIFLALEQPVVLSVRPPPSLGSVAGNVRSCCGLWRVSPAPLDAAVEPPGGGWELRAGGAGDQRLGSI